MIFLNLYATVSESSACVVLFLYPNPVSAFYLSFQDEVE
jgi:hypothetical protein